MRRTAVRITAQLLLLCSLLGMSCAFVTRQAHNVPLTGAPAVIRSPVRAHLDDGSVVVFAAGLIVRNGMLYGEGLSYGLLRDSATRVEWVPVNRVVGLERFDDRMGCGLLAGEIPLGMVGAVVLYVAIFGSCPTIYSVNAATSTMEAEVCSYSITRQLSSRDLDRLAFGAVVDGNYRILVTNEALETHYIDQLSLVTADHKPGCRALPADDGRVVLFGKTTPITRAVDAAGRDVLPLVTSRDSQWYRSDPGLLRQLADSMVRDWVELTVPVPAGANRMCLALRGRNSLLNTVLLYDVMLKGQGPAALDWLAMGRKDLLKAWSLSRWYRRHFGIRILEKDKSGFREVARVKDTGPIVWHDVAVELPVTGKDTCRLRLDFLPDNWIIDQVEVSFEQPGPALVRDWTPTSIDSGDGMNLPEEAALLARYDGSYLVTGPGDSRSLVFRTGEPPAGLERDWLVRSGGYYTEWLRRDWLQPGPVARFDPSDETIRKAARLWLEQKETYERRFTETRLPVRRLP
jgi:hypothetical protein